ncbi:MAG: hypothetical protein EHM27_16745 [Deltaproteobacteria bacterium]|nr:MAG: hypothetical protein EHM27_16745 [Deltaproteobacteria bacterium]
MGSLRGDGDGDFGDAGGTRPERAALPRVDRFRGARAGGGAPEPGPFKVRAGIRRKGRRSPGTRANGSRPAIRGKSGLGYRGASHLEDFRPRIPGGRHPRGAPEIFQGDEDGGQNGPLRRQWDSPDVRRQSEGGERPPLPNRRERDRKGRRGIYSAGLRFPNFPCRLGVEGGAFHLPFDSPAFEGETGPGGDLSPRHCLDRNPRFSMNEQYQAVYDEVSKCNRCGFCQAHCPIFDITGDERNVARGHNVHIRKLAEGDLEINPDFKDPLFECLLCKACVANCFPAVRTDKSVIAGRAEYMRRIGQPRIMHFLFHRLLPDHDKMAKFVRLAALGKNSGMAKLARAMGILNWFGKDLDKVEGIVGKTAHHLLPGSNPGTAP